MLNTTSRGKGFSVLPNDYLMTHKPCAWDVTPEELILNGVGVSTPDVELDVKSLQQLLFASTNIKFHQFVARITHAYTHCQTDSWLHSKENDF